MIKKIFPILWLFSLSSLMNLPLMQLWTEWFQISFTDNKQYLRNPRILLNVNLSFQERNNYCFCACIQAIFRYYRVLNTNNHREFSQDQLFQRFQGNPEGVPRNLDYTTWINRQFQLNNVNVIYSRTEIPQNFGLMHTDMRIFENYIVSSLRLSTPVILEYAASSSSSHCIIINGIEPYVNENETIYYSRDPNPHNQGQRQFTGGQIRSMFNNGPGSIFGANDNFNFVERNVIIRLAEQIFSGTIQDLTVELNQSVNLSHQAGITEFSELVRFGVIELNMFMITIKWFETFFYFDEDEVIFPKNIIENDLNYKQHQWLFWDHKYLNIARAHFMTYFCSSTWTEPNGDFYLNLSYRFFAKALLTTNLIDFEISLGKKWNMKY